MSGAVADDLPAVRVFYLAVQDVLDEPLKLAEVPGVVVEDGRGVTVVPAQEPAGDKVRASGHPVVVGELKVSLVRRVDQEHPAGEARGSAAEVVRLVPLLRVIADVVES